MFSRSPSFTTILNRIHQHWTLNRVRVLEQSNMVIEALQRDEEDSEETSTPDHQVFKNAQDYLNLATEAELRVFDTKYGGFGKAPKFPRPVIFNFLFSQHARGVSKKDSILHACEFTLKSMARGGMYDQLGGGFHRYSVDTEWHVPHFEKMTYDQGQLLVSYAEAFQITKDPFYANIVDEIVTYMARDMTLNSGAFYSAEDADSLPYHDSKEKREGAFYSWTYNEIRDVIGNEKGFELFCKVFDVRRDGNVKNSSDPHGELTNLNVLILRRTIEDVAKELEMPLEEAKQEIAKLNRMLFDVRDKRPRPHLDDKIITAWNGLMISGLAKSAQVMGNVEYANKAEKAAQFIRETMYDEKDGTLHRSYRHGSDNKEPISGYLNDYAFLITGLLDLYEATKKLDWLKWAIQLQEMQNQLFGDDKGGFFEVTGKDETILLRMKEDYDGAEPSGNSVSACNLVRLSQYSQTKAKEYEERARKVFGAMLRMIEKAPQAVPQLMCALDAMANPGKHIAVVYDENVSKQDLENTIRVIHEKHDPTKTLFFVNRSDPQVMQYVKQEMEYLSEARVNDNKPTVYICRNFACQAPIQDLEQLRSSL